MLQRDEQYDLFLRLGFEGEGRGHYGTKAPIGPENGKLVISYIKDQEKYRT